jgi:ABC-type branched-subunit amino acid transport system ATPase component
MSESLLKMENVDTFYGSIHILQKVNLEVGVGEQKLELLLLLAKM